jgi:hypothetical protein
MAARHHKPQHNLYPRLRHRFSRKPSLMAICRRGVSNPSINHAEMKSGSSVTSLIALLPTERTSLPNPNSLKLNQ